MLKAISRYGARFVPGFEEIVESRPAAGAARGGSRDRRLRGRPRPARQGGGHAVATSYGRMAAYYIFKALDLPPGLRGRLPRPDLLGRPRDGAARGL